MGILDIIICCAIAISLVTGLVKGLVTQLASIVAIIVGAWAGLRFSIPLGKWLGGFLSELSPVIIKVICFVIIFVAVSLVIALLGKLLDKCIKLVLLGWVNRLLGAIFAMLACALVLGLAASLFDTLYSQWASLHEVTELPRFIQDSALFRPLQNLAASIFPYLSNLAL